MRAVAHEQMSQDPILATVEVFIKILQNIPYIGELIRKLDVYLWINSAYLLKDSSNLRAIPFPAHYTDDMNSKITETITKLYIENIRNVKTNFSPPRTEQEIAQQDVYVRKLCEAEYSHSIEGNKKERKSHKRRRSDELYDAIEALINDRKELHLTKPCSDFIASYCPILRNSHTLRDLSIEGPLKNPAADLDSLVNNIVPNQSIRKLTFKLSKEGTEQLMIKHLTALLDGNPRLTHIVIEQLVDKEKMDTEQGFVYTTSDWEALAVSIEKHSTLHSLRLVNTPQPRSDELRDQLPRKLSFGEIHL